MAVLYHHIFLPQCRRVRLALDEKSFGFSLQSQHFYQRDEAFLAINPAGSLPVLVLDNGAALCGAQIICEYLEETTEPPLLGPTPIFRAEVRRLCDWFEQKFENEVVNLIVGEKVYRRLAQQGEPDPRAIRAGVNNLHTHLQYMTWLLQHRHYLAGAILSLADLAAASQISTLDYLGEMPWTQFPDVKHWYSLLKHRPSFQRLLLDRLPGLPPQRQYTNLDF